MGTSMVEEDKDELLGISDYKEAGMGDTSMFVIYPSLTFFFSMPGMVGVGTLVAQCSATRDSLAGTLPCSARH